MSIDAQDIDAGQKFTIQVTSEECTGCSICVDICPAKNELQSELKAINMEAQLPLRK